MQRNKEPKPIPVTEQDLRIAEPKLLQDHPELHHYTRWSALEAIWRTQSLRATHYHSLNDTMEITHLRTPLTNAITARYRRLLMEKQKESFAIRRRIEHAGGLLAVAADEAAQLVSALYEISFEQDDAVAVPYITSLCGQRVGSYEQKYGLLSQWRGYGSGDGFCLVVDTVKLATLVGQECDTHYFVHASLGEAMYAADDSKLETLFPAILDVCDEYLRCVLEKRSPGHTLESAFGPWITAATRYKHQGFREENEVRLVVIPASSGKVEAVRRVHPEALLKPLTAIESRDGHPFITLFRQVSGHKLPIVRIIVGPSRDQAQNIRRVKELTADTIAIVGSETPFIE